MLHLIVRVRAILLPTIKIYVASSHVQWLEGGRPNVLRTRSVLVIRDDDENRHGGSRNAGSLAIQLHDTAVRHRKLAALSRRRNCGLCISLNNSYDDMHTY